MPPDPLSVWESRLTEAAPAPLPLRAWPSVWGDTGPLSPERPHSGSPASCKGKCTLAAGARHQPYLKRVRRPSPQVRLHWDQLDQRLQAHSGGGQVWLLQSSLPPVAQVQLLQPSS